MSKTATQLEEALERAVAQFSSQQKAAALALIARGDIKAVDGLPGVYVAISSDETTKYICDAYGACQCPRRRSGKPCKHACAVILLGFAGKAA